MIALLFLVSIVVVNYIVRHSVEVEPADESQAPSVTAEVHAQALFNLSQSLEQHGRGQDPAAQPSTTTPTGVPVPKSTSV
jgi:hypothetical protein